MQVLNREDKRLYAAAVASSSAAAAALTVVEGLDEHPQPTKPVAQERFFQEARAHLFTHIRDRFWNIFDETKDNKGFYVVTDVMYGICSFVALPQDLQRFLW